MIQSLKNSKEAKKSVDYALGMGLSVQDIERSIDPQRADLLAEGS